MACVLIVDEREADRKLLGKSLESENHEAILTSGAREALAILQTRSVDVVVTDIVLPEMNGLELMKAVRQTAPQTQIVLVTGSPTFQTAAEALRARACDYLIKPVQPEHFAKAVANALRIKALEDEKQRLIHENRNYQTHLEQLVEERTRAYENSRDELRRTQMRHLAVVRSTPHGLCVLAPDWTIEFANYAMSTIFNPESAFTERLLGSPFQSLFADPREFDEYKKSAIQNVRKWGNDSRDFQMRKVDGTEFWCEISIVRHDPAQTMGGYVATLTDISDRRAATEALRKSEERYALAARGANDGLWDWDLVTGKIYFAPRWKEILGFSEEEIGDDPKEWLTRIHPEESTYVKVALRVHFAGQTRHFETEHRVRHKDGGFRWVLCRGVAVRNEQGRPIRMAGSLSDITVRKEAEQQILQKAWFDEVTGLANRTNLLNHLEHRLARARRSNDHRFAVLFIDIDRFKNVNDSLGHVVGDQLLKHVGERMLKFVRPSDTVARLGGDEFAILLDELHTERDALLVAERLRKTFDPAVLVDEHSLHVSVSIGIAVASPACQKAENLLRDADTAMYRAKEQGRDRSVIFDETFHTRAVKVLELERDLRTALRDNQLIPAYQPIVSLGGERIVGFETLVRWRHPRRGILSPGEFIPIAEETGLIVPMDCQLLEKACRQVGQWQRDFRLSPPLTLHVNFSARHFSRPSVATDIKDILTRTKFSPADLHLEITETLLLDQPEVVGPILNAIRDLGVHFSIDDFGTGYSSLSYLHRFPIDTLKIDRSFISHLENEERSASIVRTILSLADNLNLTVIAEGVETVSQRQRLQDFGCQYAQGFLFSIPLMPGDIPDLLTTFAASSGGQCA